MATRYHYHTNGRGDVYMLTDEDGNVAERYGYTLYGEPTIYRGDAPDERVDWDDALGNPLLHGGAWYDAETGFYQKRFRYYDPQLRRFLSRDPLADDSLGNLYAPFERNPLYWSDPWGLEAATSSPRRPAGFRNR